MRIPGVEAPHDIHDLLEAVRLQDARGDGRAIAALAVDSDRFASVKASKIFPPAVGYMVAVGEQSGRLEEILDKLAESYDEEVDISVQKMTSVLEPLLILVMAVVVAFIVISILLPMLQISKFQ